MKHGIQRYFRSQEKTRLEEGGGDKAVSVSPLGTSSCSTKRARMYSSRSYPLADCSRHEVTRARDAPGSARNLPAVASFLASQPYFRHAFLRKTRQGHRHWSS